MPTDKRRVLWVVEMKSGGRWLPSCRVEYMRRDAVRAAANFQHYYPNTECRVRAYVPREETSR